MALVLDETTRAEYLALSTAASRASLVVSALSGTVTVEIRNGVGALMASGTMESPWATISGATITVAEVTGVGISVATGGTPDDSWYCQFVSGSRFVRGTFGVAGSSADFRWSRASFLAGSRGALGAVTIEASGLPQVVVAPSISGSLQVGQQLALGDGTWTPSPVTFVRQLQRANSSGGTFSDISGATGALYTVTAADQGKYFRLLVTATNTSGTASSYSSTVGPVVTTGTLPTNTLSPVVFGTAQVGQRITARPGRWNDAVTLSFQWRSRTTASGTPTDVATGAYPVLSIPASLSGLLLDCVVTATNATGSVSATTPLTGAVSSATISSAPTNVTAPALKGTPTPGAVLTMQPGYWTNGPTNFACQVQRGDSASGPWTNVASGPGLTYTVQATDTWLRIGATAQNAVGVSAMTYSGALPVLAAGATPTVAQRIYMDAHTNHFVQGEVQPVRAAVEVARNTPNTPPTALASMPLVYSQHLTRLGSFKLPKVSGEVRYTFGYGGLAMVYNPVGNGGAGSLILTGHLEYSHIGEVTIPTPVDSTNFGALPTASFVTYQPNGRPESLTSGRNLDIGPIGTASGITAIYGLMIAGSRLIYSASIGYLNNQTRSHWARSLDWSVSGSETSGTAVTATNVAGEGAPVRVTAGYMHAIPAAYQVALGGTALTGFIVESAASSEGVNGPGVFTFDPTQVGLVSTLPAPTLLYYPVSAHLQTVSRGYVHNVWNYTSTPRGIVIPNGTRSLLYIGRHGYGMYAYGVGGTDGFGAAVDNANVMIYDPTDSSNGEHAWPYRYQVWAYDLGDLARVKDGTTLPWAVQPYAVWSIEMPIVPVDEGHYTGGMAYDPATRRLFIVQGTTNDSGEPVVTVFRVENAT